jgi:L-ascorbate metabolism protein UlaG (beta-lactamase superfamily)
MLIDRRSLLATAAASPLLLQEKRAAAAERQAAMRVQRLAWAGIRLEFAGSTIFLDPLTDRDVWGDALKDKLIPVSDSRGSRFVMVSHRHPDHANPKAIKEALGDDGTLVHFSGMQPLPGIRSRSLAHHEPLISNDFTATCVPAADGYGDPQVSWIINGGGKRIIHCGDTLWHGHWWMIGRQYGPFDAAFMPINGAKFKWRKPVSDVPAVLTPEQAVAAALIMGAKRLVPIHFGVTGADGYDEIEDVRRAILRAGKARGVTISFIETGDWLDWDRTT